MPLLSRRRRAVKSFSRTASHRFASKTIEGIQLGYDEYIDIDDDRISNFKDIGIDDEIDVVDDVYREAIPVLPSLFVTKCKLWREVGHNTGIRGAGTSKSTIKRQKRKAKETADAAISCKKIIGYLLSETGNTSEAIASDAAYMSTTEPSTSLAETSVSDAAVTSNLELSQSISETVDSDAAVMSTTVLSPAVPPTCSSDAVSTTLISPAVIPSLNEIDDNKVNDDYDFFHILDPYDIFNDEIVEEVVKVPPKYTMQSAITNLLDVDAKITRNKKLEKKSFLMKYQSVQGLALVRYFQLIVDGVDKMKASAEVAQVLYHKKGVWSYKARSIRGWGSHYLQTGIHSHFLRS